jgi:tryptophanyl-tRNA synthetase
MQSAPKPRPRVLSGIQPTGSLHIGNFLGALRNWARDQDRYENYFCIVDLHALTVSRDPGELRSRTLEVAALYLASGLDPARCEIFLQSQVPAHTQLGWIVECLTPMGWLERMTQFKSRSQARGRERISTGLFTYPALMTADILLYDTDYVPVGDDQRQHIELTRDVAQRLNALRAGVVKVPAPLIREVGARVMGLDDPLVKMSKSIAVERPLHAINMLDPPDVIRRKISRAQTDTETSVHEPVGAGVGNLLDIYAALHDIDAKSALAEFQGKPYSVLKTGVTEALIAALEPLQQRYAQLRADEAELRSMLGASAERASVVAVATLERVQEAVGLRGSSTK